jgi:cytochrome c oxidase subunit 2
VAKWWSLLFAVVNLGCLALFIVAPFVGWWLPEGVSTHAADIDSLFYIILWITGFFFVLTEAIMVVLMWQYGSRTDAEGKSVKPTAPVMENMVAPLKKYFPTEQRLELAWTIVPAAILLYIAFVQVDAWARIKYQSNMPSYDGKLPPLQVDVSARQFEWRFRYPSPDRWQTMKSDKNAAAKFATEKHMDDVHVVNELHVWTNEKAEANDEFPPTVVHLSTIDVQHNLNIPHFRVKQDALPGKIIPVWFRPMKANYEYDAKDKEWVYDEAHVWEIACAELCGRSHYNMKALVYVHPSEASFLKWLKEAAAAQGATQR